MNIAAVKAFFYDPIIASWAQALIYLFTLFVLIWHFRALTRQTSSQQEAVKLQIESMRQSEYLKCQTDFTETNRLLVQVGLHSKIYDDLEKTAHSSFKDGVHMIPTRRSHTHILKCSTKYLKGFILSSRMNGYQKVSGSYGSVGLMMLLNILYSLMCIMTTSACLSLDLKTI